MANTARHAMLAGIVFIGLAPGLAAWAWQRGDGRLLEGAIPFAAGSALAVGGGFLARRPAWAASFAAGTVGFLAGVTLLAATQSAISTPAGDALVSRDFVTGMRRGDSTLEQNERKERALLKRGFEAATEGHPLPAPEGGYLEPREISASRNFSSPWRFVSVEKVAPAVWGAALQKQSQAPSQAAEIRSYAPTDRPTAWLTAAGSLVTSSLVFVLLGNLAALAGRRLLGGKS